MKKLRDAYKFITILLQASINVDRCNSSPSFINLTVERFYLFILRHSHSKSNRNFRFFGFKIRVAIIAIIKRKLFI